MRETYSVAYAPPPVHTMPNECCTQWCQSSLPIIHSLLRPPHPAVSATSSNSCSCTMLCKQLSKTAAAWAASKHTWLPKNTAHPATYITYSVQVLATRLCTNQPLRTPGWQQPETQDTPTASNSQAAHNTQMPKHHNCTIGSCTIEEYSIYTHQWCQLSSITAETHAECVILCCNAKITILCSPEQSMPAIQPPPL